MVLLHQFMVIVVSEGWYLKWRVGFWLTDPPQALGPLFSTAPAQTPPSEHL
jgi:hypothetical protein